MAFRIEIVDELRIRWFSSGRYLGISSDTDYSSVIAEERVSAVLSSRDCIYDDCSYPMLL